MPYIDAKLRSSIDLKLDELFNICHTNSLAFSPGELNYIITKLLHNDILQTGLSYANLNEVIGVLECAKLELYRMIVAKYENQKLRENGPVSDLDSPTMEDVR